MAAASTSLSLALPITHHQASSPGLHSSKTIPKLSTQRTTTSPTHLSLKSPAPKTQPLPSSTPTPQTLSFSETPESSHYASLIDSCHCLILGKQLHAHALKQQFCGCREFLETRLLVMYGRCASIELACQLFCKMPLRSIYTWTAILTVYVDHDYYDEALFLFQELVVEGTALEFFVFPVLLKACGGLGALETGRGLHASVIKRGFISNIYVGNALIDMYGKCEALSEAIKILNGMPERDCVSWNSVISGCAANGMVSEALDYLEKMALLDNLKPDLVSWSAAIGVCTQNGYDEEALELLCRMLDSGIRPNAQTLAGLMPACACLEAINTGKEIHGYIMRHRLMSNSFVINGLINVYRRCGDMGSALELFLRFSVRNLITYNTMIVGYCENDELDKAKDLFDRMELDGVRRDVISWNAMISGYNNNGKFEEALMIFRDMMEGGLEADSFTLGSALSACAALAAPRQGKELHSYAISQGLEANSFVGVALVEMYCRCQDLKTAEMVFFSMAERDTIAWNVLISGHAQANQVSRSLELLSLMQKEGFEPNTYTWNGIIAGYMEHGHNKLALKMLFDMQNEGAIPDIFSIGMVIPICSRLVSIERGKQVHAYSIRHVYDTDVHVGAALVDMYAKCGSIKSAIFAFHRISQQNLVSFNSMLAGYAMHGLGKEGLILFEQLLADGLKPDEITFLSVLSSCVHGGSVKEAHRYFNLMASYNIKPELRHYTCMIDLVSRAGLMNEAYELIQSMPMKPDAVVWGALLSGCVIHGNVNLGEVAANKLIELDKSNVGNYILLANLYAAAGRQDDLVRIRQTVRNKGMHKSPGCSWIEDGDEIHVFLANDQSHKKINEIHATVERLHSHMRRYNDAVEILK